MEKGILVGVRFLDFARNDKVCVDGCHLEPVERSRKYTVTLLLPRASHVIQDNAHLLVGAESHIEAYIIPKWGSLASCRESP